ncbi:hypothetical protein AU490_16040 [Lonsdalea populi]|uniref:Lipoprotein n=1 Tax=Lonsdalea populi TaxID=1172565 RepID=A0A3N0UJG4_9GAMM|nr:MULTISPECIES: hypothetical protein [Lonsdalea]OSN01468.1 hypothetical protein AU499_06175 [Lonsdalea populi]QPQ22797.1 hypothetical protein I6N93_08745 [Lonsdalea populi]RAT18053.1 hypothetical protein AU486_02780 [Lonsdalea quercina]RAT25006.1 hypothetical protein AU490_16040 [Lonsdalea populi]RAT39540.1 hypothetical protein AU491_01770 [Lonsdalea populi]
MHFKPIFLGVLLATSVLGCSAANAADESVHGNPIASVVTSQSRAASADHTAKKLEVEREAANSRAESRQKAVQKKNNDMQEKVKTKNSAAKHHANNVNSAKEKPQELYPPKNKP